MYQIPPSPLRTTYLSLVIAWLKRSSLSWQWLLVAGSLGALSGATTFWGAKHALPTFAALGLAGSLQCVIVWAGLRVIASPPELRRPWLLLALPLSLLSATFSFMGMSMQYEESELGRVHPFQAAEELLTQARALDSAIEAGRAHALAATANRRDYLRNTGARIRSRLRSGEYDVPAQADAALAEIDATLQELHEYQDEWAKLSLDVEAVARSGQKDAYRQLREAHVALAQLTGQLRTHERQGFTLPPVPAPSVGVVAAGVTRPGLFDGFWRRLLSFSGLVWVLIALALELVPIGTAAACGAERSTNSENLDKKSEVEGIDPVDVGSSRNDLVRGNQGEIWQRNTFSVTPLGGGDRALCEEITTWNCRIRPLLFVGNPSLAQFAQAELLAEDIAALQRNAMLGEVRNEALRREYNVLLEDFRITSSALLAIDPKSEKPGSLGELLTSQIGDEFEVRLRERLRTAHMVSATY
jgi:hypothetical protein